MPKRRHKYRESFVCEHSAEFMLTNKLSEIFSREYEKVIPIFFWATREGSSIAIRSMTDSPLRIISIFARRPKISIPGQPMILVKFNQILFETAKKAGRRGMPVFAGVPLVSSLLDCDFSAKCGWFRIVEDQSSPEDTEIILNLDGSIAVTGSHDTGVVGPLSENQILQSVRSFGKLLCWHEAVDLIRESRSKPHQEGGFFPHLGVYKPFYLLLMEDKGVKESTEEELNTMAIY